MGSKAQSHSSKAVYLFTPLIKSLLIFSLITIFSLNHSLAYAEENLPFYLWRAQNNSSGAIGVKSKSYILDRHPNDEYYLTLLYNPSYYNPYGDVGLAWEIADVYGDGRFFLFVHIRYPEGSSGYIKYGPDGYKQVFTNWGLVGTSMCHYLKIEKCTHGKNNTWDLWYETGGSWYLVAEVWWPYETGNLECTQLECYEDSNPYFFMGRHSDIYLIASNGIWYLQDASWAKRIITISEVDPLWEKQIWRFI